MKAKTKKGIKRQIKIVVKGLTLACFILMVWSIVTYPQSPYYNIAEKSYAMDVNKYQNATSVNYIYEQCKNVRGQEDQVYCVHGIVKSNFKYIDNNEKYFHRTFSIHPDITFYEGGICKDWSVLYCAVYGKLGIDCEMHISHGHVFNVVWPESGYCVVDQASIACNHVTDVGQDNNELPVSNKIENKLFDVMSKIFPKSAVETQSEKEQNYDFSVYIDRKPLTPQEIEELRTIARIQCPTGQHQVYDCGHATDLNNDGIIGPFECKYMGCKLN